MANIELSAMTSASSISGVDLTYVVQGGTSKKVDYNTIFPSINSKTTITRNFSYPADRTFTVSGSGTTNIAPEGLIEFRNPADGTGANRYDGETHIYIRAGASRNERRYINYRKYDDSADDWIHGANASDTFIFYDTVAHRIWMDKGGNTLINSAGSSSVNINYHATDYVGTGGFGIYTGGSPAGNTRVFGVSSGSSGIDSQLTIDIRAGSVSDQNEYFQFKNKSGTTVYLMGKHNSNSYALYDSVNSEYAQWWDTTLKYLAIGHALPAAKIHPITTDAATNTIVNVSILGHSTSGTAGSGFGTGLLFQAEDASVDKRELGRTTFEWIVATDASRASRGKLSAYSTSTEQEAMRWDGDSGGVKIGFYGVVAVARQTIVGSRGGNAALANLITGLANIGIIIDGTSA